MGSTWSGVLAVNPGSFGDLCEIRTPEVGCRIEEAIQQQIRHFFRHPATFPWLWPYLAKCNSAIRFPPKDGGKTL
jgi:hypothetical protein